MTKEKIERKIAVIFATDVVGYSKHMAANESETIHQEKIRYIYHRWKEIKKEIKETKEEEIKETKETTKP